MKTQKSGGVPTTLEFCHRMCDNPTVESGDPWTPWTATSLCIQTVKINLYYVNLLLDSHRLQLTCTDRQQYKPNVRPCHFR